MGKDYYKLLGVARDANDDELKKAFEQISEAFFVLSDPEKRAVYDQYGEEGLKSQVPPPFTGIPRSPHGRYIFFQLPHGRHTTFSFNPRWDVDIFSELIGYLDPYYIGGVNEMDESNPRSAEDSLSDLFAHTKLSSTGLEGSNERSNQGAFTEALGSTSASEMQRQICSDSSQEKPHL